MIVKLLTDCSLFQFNFKFNLSEDMYAEDSVELLQVFCKNLSIWRTDFLCLDLCRILEFNLNAMRGRESKLFTLLRSSLSLALSFLIMSSGSVFTRAMTLVIS